MSDIIPISRKLRPKDLVLRFMDSVGHRRDAEVYLKLFTSKSPESFAIMVLDEEALSEELDAIIFDLRYLMRLELYPVVVIHAPTDSKLVTEVDAYFQKAKLSSGFLPLDLPDEALPKLTLDRIKHKQLATFHLPLEKALMPELAGLAAKLKTSKILFLKRERGFIDPATREHMSIVNLRFDRDRLLSHPHFPAEHQKFLLACEELMKLCEHRLFISLVAPINLLRELFTVKGAGTLIQMGSLIFTYVDWAQVDYLKLRDLLQTSFEKKISEDFFLSQIDRFYIEENYLGACLTRQYSDMTYLSKFAVGTEARGLGIGRDLWNELIKNHHKIFWRSSNDKFITTWYQKQCDGMHRSERWTVFWKGIDPEQIPVVIKFALEQPDDFVPHEPEAA